MVHIYYGDGKGKTTAALGLAIRAAGCGKKVLICRFLKDSDSGELKIISKIKNIDIFDCGCVSGFYTAMDSKAQNAVSKAQHKACLDAVRKAADEKYDLIVLDEILWLKEFDIISAQELSEIIKSCAFSELVLTGGKASDEILALADYVTNMKKISHPYDKGIPLRAGVEF